MHVVPAADLHAEIARITPSIQRVMEGHDEGDADRLVQALQDGNAKLIVEGPNWVAVTVVGPPDHPSLFLWAGTAVGTGNLKHYLPILQELADSLDCNRLVLHSNRAGMARALGAGWEPAYTEFVFNLMRGR